jgi:ABC-type sulfate/molybdate transport systems ATPase subunit
LSSSALLRVRGLTASWGAEPVLRGIDIELGRNELLSVLGPNGAGKSTLLRVLAGLEPALAGTIELDGVRVEDRPAHLRGIGLVPQEPSLFAGRTVAENLAYAPRVHRRPATEVERTVRELLELLDIAPLAARYPTELSGGEQQRVALARALAAGPSVILLDEPFAAVDPEFRAELRGEFRRILAARGTAAVHVTHDREEALFLGDRVAVLWSGRIEQIGSPREVHDRPRTAAIARFLGYNVVRDGQGLLAVDPHELSIVPAGGSGLAATVLAVGVVGRETSVLLRTGNGDRLELRIGSEVATPVRPGTPVGVRWSGGVRVASAGGAGNDPEPAG